MRTRFLTVGELLAYYGGVYYAIGDESDVIAEHAYVIDYRIWNPITNKYDRYRQGDEFWNLV